MVTGAISQIPRLGTLCRAFKTLPSRDLYGGITLTIIGIFRPFGEWIPAECIADAVSPSLPEILLFATAVGSVTMQAGTPISARR